MAGGLLAAMIIGCLYCAHDLWKRGTPAGWCTVALMNLAMVALHTPMPAHHHHGSRQGAGSGQPTLMMLAVLLALAEATIAAVVLYCCTRKRSVIPLPSQGM
jgi:hypothetical protein